VVCFTNSSMLFTRIMKFYFLLFGATLTLLIFIANFCVNTIIILFFLVLIHLLYYYYLFNLTTFFYYIDCQVGQFDNLCFHTINIFPVINRIDQFFFFKFKCFCSFYLALSLIFIIFNNYQTLVVITSNILLI